MPTLCIICRVWVFVLYRDTALGLIWVLRHRCKEFPGPCGRLLQLRMSLAWTWLEVLFTIPVDSNVTHRSERLGLGLSFKTFLHPKMRVSHSVLPMYSTPQLWQAMIHHHTWWIRDQINFSFEIVSIGKSMMCVTLSACEKWSNSKWQLKIACGLGVSGPDLPIRFHWERPFQSEVLG